MFEQHKWWILGTIGFIIIFISMFIFIRADSVSHGTYGFSMWTDILTYFDRQVRARNIFYIGIFVLIGGSVLTLIGWIQNYRVSKKL
ncbi:MAG: hypothetical protein ACFFCM_10175 [Promethearchaeota archaeon]